VKYFRELLQLICSMITHCSSYKVLHVTPVAVSDTCGFCLFYLLLVIEPLENDVRVLWPYTVLLKDLRTSFLVIEEPQAAQNSRKNLLFLRGIRP
jgi:hypothetical protein